jgi:hypothetical protein
MDAAPHRPTPVPPTDPGATMATSDQPTPRLGAWARADGVVGVVARVDAGRITLFDPAQRHQHTVPAVAVEVVPSAAVRVTATVDLPLPHGASADDVRRWVAMLTDPVLRERAAEALAEAGLAAGVAQPAVEVTAVALRDGQARCLCGATIPSAGVDPRDRPRALPACPRCGRQPAPPVTASDA